MHKFNIITHKIDHRWDYIFLHVFMYFFPSPYLPNKQDMNPRYWTDSKCGESFYDTDFSQMVSKPQVS